MGVPGEMTSILSPTPRVIYQGQLWENKFNKLSQLVTAPEGVPTETGYKMHSTSWV